MKILSVDTSTAQLNVCMSDDGHMRAETSLYMGHTHTRSIMPAIDHVLALAGLDVSAVDGFAVTLGPGSFTGIRIGISTVKGLATAVGKPVAGVSSLDALAYQTAAFPHLICTLLDARKKEVYCCFYRWKGNSPCKMTPDAVLPISLAMGHLDEKCLFIGSGALLYQRDIAARMGANAVFPPSPAHAIHASTVGHLGDLQFRLGNHSPAAEIFPRYLRPPDAVKN